MVSRTPVQELGFRLIKIADIGYITVLYFLIAFFLSTWVDVRLLGPFKPEVAAQKSTHRLLGECILHIYLIGILIYITRNMVELIPSPFNGIQGFEHLRVKELTNAAVFTFIFLFYQRHLREKLVFLGDRIYKKQK